MTQLFCAVQVTAVGDYICFFEYNDASTTEYPNIEQPKNSYTIDNGVSLDKTIEESGEAWPDAPARIIGKRFLGWFVNDIQITPETKLTADMVSNKNNIKIEGKWAVDDCADIESAVLRSYDHLGNMLSSDVELRNSSGNPIEFSSDVTEYYIKVLDNAVFAEFDFRVHEPAAAYDITYNGSAAASAETVVKTYSEAEQQEFPSGIDVSMERVTLAEKSDGQEYNDIVIPITAKNGAVKTYKFHIERSHAQIKLAYGNTPFGRIAKDYSSASWTEADRQEKRDTFSNTYTFYGSNVTIQNKYDPKAWGEGEEVAGGVETSGGQYRNYDKDGTA
ncbi:MAG: hypothetical protein ACI4A5_09905, partial [Hominilimicola sp.]